MVEQHADAVVMPSVDEANSLRDAAIVVRYIAL